MDWTNRSTLWLCMAACLTLAGCIDGTQTTAGNTEIDVENEGDASNYVCNPFGGSGARARDQGLKARLAYLPPALPPYTGVADYL